MSNQENQSKKTLSENSKNIPENIKAKLEALKVQADKYNLGNASKKSTAATSYIYNYPENYSVMDISIKGGLGEKFRRKARNNRDIYLNNVTVVFKQHQNNKATLEDVLQEVKIFVAFYKENYTLNNFEVRSISDKPNETKDAIRKVQLDIIKTFVELI